MRAVKLRRYLCAVASMLVCPAIANAGTFKTIYTFGGANDGVGPEAALIIDNGALFGTTSRGGPSGAGTVFTMNLQSGVESVLTTDEGLLPYTPVLYANHRLYGTTSAGDNGDGNIFEFNLKTGVATSLYDFPRGRDQAYPSGLLKLGGNLYGTTYNAGSYDYGSIFQYNVKTGSVTTLYSFTGGSDGKYPVQLLPKGGLLYGVASQGGAGGSGVIFSLNIASSAETTLYSFSGSADGSSPNGLSFHQGLLYGTASYGGPNSDGTVFTMDPATNKVSVLYSFVGGADGCTPIGKPIIYKGGLYSVAASCGSTANQGTLFEVRLSSGKLQTLHVFANGADGVSPGAGLLLDQGALYGTAAYGGANNAGTIFQYLP